MRTMKLDVDSLTVNTFEAQQVVAAHAMTGLLETCAASCVYFCDSSTC